MNTNIMRHYLLAGLAVILVIVITGYALKSQTTNLPDPKQLDHLPDAVITNMHVTSFNEAGQRVYIITTPQLEHYSQGNRSYLSNPRLTLLKAPEEPWQIRSDYARTENGTEVITLWDNVVLHQAGGLENVESTITTTELTYYPKEQIASTDQPITLQQPGVTINAIGMLAYIEEEIVELLSDAQGQYETTS